MTRIVRICAVALFLAFASVTAWADDDAEAIQLFRNAGQSGAFFSKSYGYAVFPTIGKAGLGIGGAHGDGHVYEKGKVIGETSMTQLSIGLQAGGEAYSEIIFFQDKRRPMNSRPAISSSGRHKRRRNNCRGRRGSRNVRPGAGASGGRKTRPLPAATTRAWQYSRSLKAA